MNDCENYNQGICSLLSNVLDEKTLCESVFDCKFKKFLYEATTIKRSECPYRGIDCAWCGEDCE